MINDNFKNNIRKNFRIVMRIDTLQYTTKNLINVFMILKLKFETVPRSFFNFHEISLFLIRKKGKNFEIIVKISKMIFIFEIILFYKGIFH